MRIVFSRKGFDSTAGGGPSPIVGGRPVSLPIPATGPSRTHYADLGLGELAAAASKGRHGPGALCHHDPMFLSDGTCLFGQCGAAQSHLENRGVRPGDVFLFFGLFQEPGGEPHHRIFGYLRIEEAIALRSCPEEDARRMAALGHPHALGLHAGNDVIWRGPGRTARTACERLRLSLAGGPPTLWRRPPWLRPGGLSYHARSDRWLPGGRLRAVSRGQEFVAEIGQRSAPRAWLAKTLAAVDGQSHTL